MKRCIALVCVLSGMFILSACSMHSSAAEGQTSPSMSSSGSSDLQAGKEVYNKSCAACHASGVMGAPKTGDKNIWESLLAKGKGTLYDHSIKGYKSMPPRGGNSSLTDKQVKAAVDYMVQQSK